MSLSFILGNLLGRALVSYAIVWIVCWLLRRFDWRAASRASLRWYSLLLVVLLTWLGTGGTLLQRGAA